MARILIVDDAAFMRMMLKDILTKGGFEIAGEAADGNEAVAKYNELKPDLVTLDITMPNKDGIQALKEIKAADPNATCVMCSAMGQQSMVIDAIQSGAKDFIVKPFQADRVIESIRKVLGPPPPPKQGLSAPLLDLVLLYFCNCSVPSQLRKTLNSLIIKNNLCMLHKKSPFVSPCNDIICILICYDRHLFKLMLIIAR